jgi:hypothetical protein
MSVATDNVVRSEECAGRYTIHEDGTRTLAVPVVKYEAYIAEQGLSEGDLSSWIALRGVFRKRVRLVQYGPRVMCYVIPLNHKEVRQLDQEFDAREN